MYDAKIALSLAHVRTLGETPTQPPFSSPFIFWCLIDLTPPPHKIPLTLWGIHGWRSYAPAMGYHEPQNG